MSTKCEPLEHFEKLQANLGINVNRDQTVVITDTRVNMKLRKVCTISQEEY